MAADMLKFFERFMPNRSIETRAGQPTSWDLLRMNMVDVGNPGLPISPALVENLATVFAATQRISESIAMLPLHMYRKLPNGGRELETKHPVAKLFLGDPNELQTVFEWLELMAAIVLLRGNSYSEILRSGGAIIGLRPLHPDLVSQVRLPNGRYAYDVSERAGGTRRVLADDMLHVKDRSDDGIVGISRLSRAREAFSGALVAERFASQVFSNGAALSGVLKMTGNLSAEATERLRDDFKTKMQGPGNAGSIAVLEGGMDWQQISVSPDDAQALQSREFNFENLCRIFGCPPMLLGSTKGGTYSSVSEATRWFNTFTIGPWLVRLERAFERALLSTADRAIYELEFDTDLLLRSDFLTRMQGYRVAREIGLANANELRKWEHLNPRTDPEAETYLSPLNMASEQSQRPIADRGAEK